VSGFKRARFSRVVCRRDRFAGLARNSQRYKTHQQNHNQKRDNDCRAFLIFFVRFH
jgi:hypothetical protein